MKLVSACLIGCQCRYNGKSKTDERILKLIENGETLIPICPEQLGGLPTPRLPSEQKDDKVFTNEGKEVTENFLRGAEETLRIAKLLKIKEAILKQKSPSCGCGKIFDGTFSGTLINGDGETTKLLKENGIKVISEEDL
ncbi:DUF523 domain-containing protein [Nanoarchaeota archaeon]